MGNRGNWLRSLAAIGSANPRPGSVIVYTRAGCHLCDEACDVLRRHGLQPNLVDIDQDPQLREQYNDCVPVVLLDGKIRFRGRINEVLLKRLVRYRP